MRVAKIVVLTVFVVISIQAAGMWLLMRNQGFSAKEKPSWMESMMARQARNVATPSDAKTLKNPRTVSEDTIAEAREHWTEHCSFCHGIDGRGSAIGLNMYPPAPNMNDAQTQQKTDGELFYIVSHGIRLTGMPAWEGMDSPEALWDIVSFIRHLPQLSPEELKQMQELAGEESVNEAVDDAKGSQDKTVDKNKDPHAGMPGMNNSSRKGKPAKGHSHEPGTKPHEH